MRAACLQRVLAAILCGVEQSDMTRTVLTLVMASAALAPLAVAGRQPQQPADHPRFRVAVDAVRIDAVVTDRDGRIVSDLTADDFEVLQDGKRQRVTFAQFVPVLSSPVSPASAPSPRRSTGPVPPPATPAPVTRASIQRTFAIVVDDLGLSLESVYYLKRGAARLHRPRPAADGSRRHHAHGRHDRGAALHDGSTHPALGRRCPSLERVHAQRRRGVRAGQQVDDLRQSPRPRRSE